MIPVILVFAIFAIFVWSIVGLVRPQVAMRWAKEERRTRKSVLMAGILAVAIWFCAMVIGVDVSKGRAMTPYAIADIFSFCSIMLVMAWGLIGLIEPTKAIRWGAEKRRNRKWVVAYFVIFFLVLLLGGVELRDATITPQERAERAAEIAANHQAAMARQQAEQEQEDLKKKAAEQEKAKAAAEEAAKKEAAAAEEAKKNEQQEAAEPAPSEQEDGPVVQEDGPVRIYDRDVFAEQQNYTVVYEYNLFGNTLKAYVDRNSIDKSENDKIMSADVEIVTHVKDTSRYTNLSETYEYKKGWFLSWQYRTTIKRRGEGAGPWKDLGSADDGNEKAISEALKKYLEDYSLVDSVEDKVKSLF